MPSAAGDVYDRLDADVGTLLDLHPAVANPGAGRPPGDTGPLLRSSVVLIHTAWENYVEQFVLEAASALLATIGDDHTRLPGGLRRGLEEKFGDDPWALAGTGWRTEAVASVQVAVGRLNTPNSNAVEGLCKKYLGIRDVFDRCGWQNKQPEAVRADLDQLVHEVRGEIVHKGRTVGPLTLGGVRSWRDFVGRLVQRLDTVTADEFESAHGTRPWPAA